MNALTMPDGEGDPLKTVHAGLSSPDGDVRPHVFGDTTARQGVRLAGLERLGDRLARQVRLLIEPLAHAKAQVTAEPPATMRFEAFRSALPSFISLNLYRMRPLKGSLMVVIDPAFVSRLVDSFYGGRGSAQSRGEFTATEERLATRLADQIAEKLQEGWAEVMPLTLQLAGRETNAAYASLVRPEETVVVHRLAIAPGAALPSTISIVYPMASLRPIESLLAARVQDDAGPPDTEWRERLADALAEVRMPVRSVLARPELSVSQLLALKPGDIIPITLAPLVPLAVAGRKLAQGTIGEREGRAAMVIEKIGGGA